MYISKYAKIISLERQDFLKNYTQSSVYIKMNVIEYHRWKDPHYFHSRLCYLKVIVLYIFFLFEFLKSAL